MKVIVLVLHTHTHSPPLVFLHFDRDIKSLLLFLKLWTTMPVLLSMAVRLSALALLFGYGLGWCGFPKSYISWLWENKILQSRCPNGNNSQNQIYSFLTNQYLIYTRIFFFSQNNSLTLQVLFTIFLYFELVKSEDTPCLSKFILLKHISQHSSCYL